jgi:hypothetical protein
VAASVEELAFDLALDSLDLQRDVLRDIRARSATLLTASSIVTSFVGGRAIDAVGLDAFTAAVSRWIAGMSVRKNATIWPRRRGRRRNR